MVEIRCFDWQTPPDHRIGEMCGCAEVPAERKPAGRSEFPDGVAIEIRADEIFSGKELIEGVFIVTCRPAGPAL